MAEVSYSTLQDWQGYLTPLSPALHHACMVAYCHFSHVRLCDPKDCSLPGSSVQRLSRQEHWRGSPFPSPGGPPEPGTKPHFLHLLHGHWQAGSLPLAPPALRHTLSNWQRADSTVIWVQNFFCLNALSLAEIVTLIFGGSAELTGLLVWMYLSLSSPPGHRIHMGSGQSHTSTFPLLKMLC